MKKCKTCRVYEPFEDSNSGKCRRFPPVPDNKGDATVDEFPVVKEDDWCGEHCK